MLQDSLVETVKGLTGGAGATVTIDTTGNRGVIKVGLELTGIRGQMMIIGVPPADAELAVHLIPLLQTGKQLRGVIEGDATPAKASSFLTSIEQLLIGFSMCRK
jgi:aryl-alcohol dehydrogenase